MSHESEMPRDPLGLEATDQNIRLNELRERAREMGIEGGTSEDCPPAIEEQFLSHVMEYETAPLGTRFVQLQGMGIELPEAHAMDDATLTAKLWEIIRALASVDVFLSCTDHLSDRELYEHLWTDSLREVVPILPPGSGWNNHIDIIGGGSEKDCELMLRYYSTDESRAHWAHDFPEDVMPPKEKPPFDRDRLLPKPPPPPMMSDEDLSEWELEDDELDELNGGEAEA